MRLNRLLVASLAVLAFVAAACGDDEEDAAEAPAATTTAAPAVEEPMAEEEEMAEEPMAEEEEMAEEPMAEEPMVEEEPMAMEMGFDVDAALDADFDNCVGPTSDEPLLIGFAADLSEVGGFADIPISEAGQHYIGLINCAGGVNGTPVVMFIEDVQGDPEVAQRATADLLSSGAHVILGPPFADVGDAVLQTVNASRAVIFVASTEPVLPDPSIYSFMTTFSDTQQAEAAAQFAIDAGITRAITFSSEGPYFGYNPETFAAKFEELGGELVLDVSYVPFEDFDFASHANEVAGVADGTEILYTAMIAPQLDALRGAIEERGIGTITYFGADAFGVSGITEIPNNEGVYWTDHGFGAEREPLRAPQRRRWRQSRDAQRGAWLRRSGRPIPSPWPSRVSSTPDQPIRSPSRRRSRKLAGSGGRYRHHRLRRNRRHTRQAGVHPADRQRRDRPRCQDAVEASEPGQPSRGRGRASGSVPRCSTCRG